MSAHTTIPEAQQGLEQTKLTVSAIDPELESSVWSVVWGQLAGAFGRDVVNTWVDTNTTPVLVQQVVSLLYASYYYRKEYSEVAAAEAGNSYDANLESL